MKKLSKSQQVKHGEIVSLLTTARDDLVNAVSNFNEKVEALYAEIVAPKVAEVNSAAEQANEFVQEIHGEQEEYASDRSEKWTDSDAGSAYSDWMTEWEVEIETIELEEPTPYEEPTLDGLDEFEQLAMEVSS